MMMKAMMTIRIKTIMIIIMVKSKEVQIIITKKEDTYNKQINESDNVFVIKKIFPFIKQKYINVKI